MPPECFVISPIGERGSSTRKHADQVLKHLISPITEKHGYTVTRADILGEPGLITHQIIQRLVQVPLTVADLTDHNPNVFYELAIRHAAHLPTVHIARVGEKLPFDIAGFRTVFFDLSDPDTLDEARAELDRQIESASTSSMESPVSAAVSLQRLTASSDPIERTLADVLLSITDVRARVEELSDRFIPPNRMDGIFTPLFLESLLDAVPLSRVVSLRIKLKRAGKEWRSLSPFSEEKTPSFFVNDHKRAWFDFSSGRNGGLFEWIMAIENLPYPQAVLRAIDLNEEAGKDRNDD